MFFLRVDHIFQRFTRLQSTNVFSDKGITTGEQSSGPARNMGGADRVGQGLEAILGWRDAIIAAAGVTVPDIKIRPGNTPLLQRLVKGGFIDNRRAGDI